jgi:hypothetical protein
MITFPDYFSDESKIWIYQSDRKLKPGELSEMNAKLETFATNWVSHNIQLKAFGGLYLDQIIVLMVDESKSSASGCSIDSSVAFIKGLGQQFEVDFFNRWNFLYLDDDNCLQTISKDEFQLAFQKGTIHLNTLFIDTLVKNLSEFKNGFVKPLNDSWHKNFLNVKN